MVREHHGGVLVHRELDEAICRLHSRKRVRHHRVRCCGERCCGRRLAFGADDCQARYEPGTARASLPSHGCVRTLLTLHVARCGKVHDSTPGRTALGHEVSVHEPPRAVHRSSARRGTDRADPGGRWWAEPSTRDSRPVLRSLRDAEKPVRRKDFRRSGGGLITGSRPRAGCVWASGGTTSRLARRESEPITVIVCGCAEWKSPRAAPCGRRRAPPGRPVPKCPRLRTRA